MTRRDRDFLCPNCDARVPARASACPECGADDETGWSDTATSFDADSSAGYGNDDDFDYAEWEQRHRRGDEASSLSRRQRNVILIVLLALILGALRLFL